MLEVLRKNMTSESAAFLLENGSGIVADVSCGTGFMVEDILWLSAIPRKC
jgi:hypothetical protein